MNNEVQIEEKWEKVPENAIKIDTEFISHIPSAPLCISAENLRTLLGIKKATLSYHIKKYRDSLNIYVANRKHYYQQKD